MKPTTQQFLKDTGAEVPIVCGPMYPGLNPELITAISAAGSLGWRDGISPLLKRIQK